MMRPKNRVLPALCAVALLSSMSTARAQEFYMGLHVGFNVIDNGDFESGGGNVSAEYDPRPVFGGSFGNIDASGFRIEGELTHRINDFDNVAGVNVKGQLSSTALMINMLYELHGNGSGYGYGRGSGSSLRPYIGAGGGGAYYTMNATNDLTLADIVDDATYGLAYQGILGIGVEISDTALVTLDFRYLVSDNVEFTDEFGTPFEVDVVQATAMLGLRTTF